MPDLLERIRENLPRLGVLPNETQIVVFGEQLYGFVNFDSSGEVLSDTREVLTYGNTEDIGDRIDKSLEHPSVKGFVIRNPAVGRHLEATGTVTYEGNNPDRYLRPSQNGDGDREYLIIHHVDPLHAQNPLKRDGMGPNPLNPARDPGHRMGYGVKPGPNRG